MNKFSLIILFFCYNLSVFGQAGAGPIQNCSSTIPEICNGALYPAATSGTATAPFGANLNCGFTSISGNASFYYFVSNTNGPLNINITPTDVIGIPYPNVNTSPDLDFKCWGPFNDLLTMCDQLTNLNQEDCSSAPATTAEVLQIANAVAGEIYVVMVSNWADVGSSPDPCFIQFTSFGPNDAFGGPSPGDAGGSVGVNTPILFCDSDPVIDLIDELNGNPLTYGTWFYNGDTVSGSFDPASDPTGTYSYTIPGTANCPSDTAYVILDVFSASNISITSQSTICSNETGFTLTGIPVAGWSSQGQGVFTNSSGTIITDFDPAIYGPGNHNVTYTYTPNGCAPVPYTSSITVNEAPTVLSSNVTITNPSCFGFNDGSAIVTPTLGTTPYVADWFGEDPLQLTSGTFDYTITDNNGCIFSNSVSLYDPLNTSSIINEFNSSCFGTDDGSASITVFGGTTPPGNISTLSYCASNPSSGFSAQPQTSIGQVQLNGNNFNINNSTFGTNDFYEDYTTTMFADLTEGQVFTVNVTPHDEFAVPGSYAPEAINVYTDFNIDGDFLDAGEDLGVINIPVGTWIPGTVYPFTFAVPATGAYGPTRMRVVCMSNGGGGTNGNPAVIMGPCEDAGLFGIPWFGATEDYSIVLNAPASSATYQWFDGSTSDSISNLGPGTYSVIITVGGCPVQDFATITEPEEIIFNPNISEITCNGFDDAIINFNNISGGNGGPYNITDWGGIIDPNNVAVGTYTISANDLSTITTTNPNACENDTTIIISEPEYFSVDFSILNSEICLNDPITLDFDFNQGGIAPYTVNYTVNGNPQVAGPINNGGQNSIDINPSSGNNTYIITDITDANGCSNQNSITSQDIYVNPLPDINIAVAPNPICVGDNSSLIFSTPDGTPPYIVDYLEGGVLKQENVPAAGLNLVISPNQTTNYELTYVTDSKGCVSDLTGNNTILTVNEIPQLTFTSPNETCDGDIIQLKFNFTAGAAPWIVNYSVNGSPTSIPFNNSVDSIAISPATQTVYVINSITDNNSCTNNITQALNINTNPLPEINISGGGSICDDGSTAEIMFSINSGTPPYNLTYSAGLIQNSVSNIGSTYSVTTDQTGAYTVQNVTDINGCEAISISGSAFVNVNPLPEANFSLYPQPADILNPQITFTDLSNNHASGIWDFDDGNYSVTNFDKITHLYTDTGTFQVSLTVESDSGCINIATQTVIISPVFSIYVPSAFTPNNDLYNDYFLPIVNGVLEYELSIYNREGQRIFKSNEFSNDYLSCVNNNCLAAWDGKINNGAYASKGAYIYSIILKDIKGKIKTYEGTVMLLK